MLVVVPVAELGQGSSLLVHGTENWVAGCLLFALSQLQQHQIDLVWSGSLDWLWA